MTIFSDRFFKRDVLIKGSITYYAALIINDYNADLSLVPTPIYDHLVCFMVIAKRQIKNKRYEYISF